MLKFEIFLIYILKIMLIISSVFIIIGLYKHFSSSTEIVPGSVFVVLLSLSALCMSWARLDVICEVVKKAVYESGIELFLSSMLVLVSLPVPWFCKLSKLDNTIIEPVLKYLHVILVFLALIVAYRAIVRLLNLLSEKRNCK
ncbi:MAG TPA: hypothetical protein QF753_10755 [Victivallales bacterium]|nr:hypothetical protein [Victivallales bacterium]